MSSWKREHEKTVRMYKRGKRRVSTRIVCLVLCISAILCKQYYPQGTKMAVDFLLGGERSPVRQAFYAMSHSLKEGESLGRAVNAFAMELKDGEN